METASKPKRRAYLPAAERRKSIIAAAQQVFAHANLKGARTRDIAKAAEVNQATIFEHFESKEALFQEAVVQPLIDAMRGMHARKEIYETAHSPDELAGLALESATRHVGDMIDIFPLLAAAMFSDPDLGRELYRESIAPLIRQRGQILDGLTRDRITYRPNERAAAQPLHVDSSYGFPTDGRGMLRLFCNIDPGHRPRVWQIGEPFETFVGRFLPGIELVAPSRKAAFLARFGIGRGARSAYDRMMAEIRRRGKRDALYQGRIGIGAFGGNGLSLGAPAIARRGARRVGLASATPGHCAQSTLVWAVASCGGPSLPVSIGTIGAAARSVNAAAVQLAHAWRVGLP